MFQKCHSLICYTTFKILQKNKNKKQTSKQNHLKNVNKFVGEKVIYFNEIIFFQLENTMMKMNFQPVPNDEKEGGNTEVVQLHG